MSNPLVSVIIPTHNRLAFLCRAVASVLEQSEKSIELIIVDDASTDGTADYLTKLALQDRRVKITRNLGPRGGAYARNIGISISAGKWVAFLDDDDEWLPHKLERQLGELNSNPNACACTCSYVLRSANGTANKVVTVPGSVTLQQLLIDNVVGGASMCICSQEILVKIGGFDGKLRSAQDLDLWVRLRQKGEIAACQEALVLYQAHNGSRITTNMDSQYFGSRRFYWKHRHVMNRKVRRHRAAFTSFIMSRQTSRRIRYRFHYLFISLFNSAPEVRLAYFRSSFPRLLSDIWKDISI